MNIEFRDAATAAREKKHVFQDENLRVQAVPIRLLEGADGPGADCQTRTSSEAVRNSSAGSPRRSPRASPTHSRSSFSPERKKSRTSSLQTASTSASPRRDAVVCYVCELADIPGKFDSKKAKVTRCPQFLCGGRFCCKRVCGYVSARAPYRVSVCSPPGAWPVSRPDVSAACQRQLGDSL